MKFPGPLKHFIFAFIIALVLYVSFYRGIEHRRTRNGPWQVTFTNALGAPALIINEPNLSISNVTIRFPGQPPSMTNSFIVFDPPRDVPFDVPFGQCIFMDTTFQPGTVVFSNFNYEIQLLPRVLTIDKVERPWKSGETIDLKP
jgi:hypothetical protein